MDRNTIENIFNFLKEKEDKELPKKWFDSIEKFKLIKELETHPDGTQYKHNGNLNLINTNITKLPNDLYVEGGLFLMGCSQLTELPDELYVGGLNLGGLTIKELPNDLHVTYDLSLYNCKQITELPNNLHVGNEFFIRGTPLADKYTNKQIIDIVTSTGGLIVGKILR